MTMNSRRFLPGIALALGLIFLAVVARTLPTYYIGLLTEALILGLFAMSLNLLLGYTGLPSLGHAAYFGTAAYTMAILSLRVAQNCWVSASAGIVASLIIAAIYGLLALRTAGVYFMMITLALTQVLWGIAYGWRTMTGGDDGLPGIARPDLGGLFPWSLQDPANFFTAVLIIFAVVAATLYLLVHSPFGYTLRGIRESESRMDCLGYNVWLHKYVAMLIAGGVAGIAGILFAYYHGFVSPAELSLVVSAEGLLMVIVGGAGTLFGPALGAGVVVFLRNIVSAYTERWLLVLGLIYLLVVLFAPHGIVGAVQARLPRWLYRRAKP
jgi:branched-chain amino acid transport system permease protein